LGFDNAWASGGGGRVRQEETKQKNKKFLFLCCSSRGRRRRRVLLKTTLFCVSVLFLCGDLKMNNNICPLFTILIEQKLVESFA